MNNENSMDVSIYKRLSQIDHILIRPDTYVGSLTPELQWFKGVVIENDKWVGKEMTGKISPAFYKIFDEIVSNASDHTQRNAGVTEIKI
jgi:DNA topoisomerase-2